VNFVGVHAIAEKITEFRLDHNESICSSQRHLVTTAASVPRNPILFANHTPSFLLFVGSVSGMLILLKYFSVFDSFTKNCSGRYRGILAD
jgi:hypothetical protein